MSLNVSQIIYVCIIGLGYFYGLNTNHTDLTHAQ